MTAIAITRRETLVETERPRFTLHDFLHNRFVPLARHDYPQPSANADIRITRGGIRAVISGFLPLLCSLIRSIRNGGGEFNRERGKQSEICNARQMASRWHTFLDRPIFLYIYIYIRSDINTRWFNCSRLSILSSNRILNFSPSLLILERIFEFLLSFLFMLERQTGAEYLAQYNFQSN